MQQFTPPPPLSAVHAVRSTREVFQTAATPQEGDLTLGESNAGAGTRHLDPFAGVSRSPSMVSVVQENWVELGAFFLEAQCADTEEERQDLAYRLPTVEHHLNNILDALLTEHKRLVAAVAGVGDTDGITSTLLRLRQQHNAQRTSQAAPDGVPTSSFVSVNASESSRAKSASPLSVGLAAAAATAAAGTGGGVSTLAAAAPLQLPPCYHYLFGEPQGSFEEYQAIEEDAVFHRAHGGAGGRLGTQVTPMGTVHTVGSSPEDPAVNSFRSPPQPPSSLPTTSLEPSSGTITGAERPPGFLGPAPISSTFLLMLCQYAKHNEPAGSRQIILHFLTRLLQEADLPTQRTASNGGGGASGGGGWKPRSLLQLQPSWFIVPVLDMVRKVGAALDPTLDTRRNGTLGGSQRGGSAKTGKGGAGGGGAGAAAHTVLTGELSQDDAERTEFVLFLCALAEKTERVPELANFFVARHDVVGGGRGAGAGAVPQRRSADGVLQASGGPSAREKPLYSFVLLETLLPYMTHDSSSAEWKHRRDTCRYALSAVLSLSKCPDPWIRDLVGSEASIATRTISTAGTTLLTLCMIPDNDDSEVQLQCLRDVLRFWSVLFLCSPMVAQQLQLLARIEEDFAQNTLLPLFRATATHTYAAACLVTSHLLRDLNSSATVLSEIITRALLGSVVRSGDGRVLPRKDYYEVMAEPALRQPPSESGGTAGGGASGLTSFAAYYLLPHLTSNPTLSEEDEAHRVVLGFAMTAWTAAESTLVLLKSIAENSPAVFLRYALLLDMATLPEVLVRHRKLQQRDDDVEAVSAPSAALCHADLSAAATAPRIDLGECFSPRLRAPHDVLGDVSGALLGEEVLERLLRIEGNMPLEALEMRQCVVNAFCRVPGAVNAATKNGKAGMTEAEPTPATGAHMQGTVGEEGESAIPSSSPSAGQRRMSAGAYNVWLHHGVQQSPVVITLCNLLGALLELPRRARLLLTDTLLALCLLPDLRVLYTLLDPEYGRLDHALHKLRAIIDNELDEDEAVAFATAAAAAAVAGDVRTLPAVTNTSITKVAGFSFGASPSSSTSVTATTATSSNAAPTVGSAAGRKVSAKEAAKEAAVTGMVQTAASLLTRGYLYEMYVRHWAEIESEGTTGEEEPTTTPDCPTLLTEEVRHGIAAHKAFLEACCSVEWFRMELDAASAYMALSHNLMALRPGDV